ncbi:sensor histidine kinase [Pseudokordiimonas caeni]|uniref:sensor histidine kinase n=1 Tax=Pseudokordiimonas caeni TaxID=2997908 RepID=UPI00281198E9|nr:histidine kinase [Pseudokordiimonas caeni]
MNKLFIDRGRTFWIFQSVGWLGYGMVRMFHGMTVGQPMADYYKLIIVAIAIGLLMTSGMRRVYHLVRGLSLPVVLVTSIVLCSVLGLLFSSIETAIVPMLMDGFEPPVGLARFGNAMFEATALFAWTAIYFGYHYYTGFQEQQEQALKATAMAHQAQLKMLRYQLNPHFLFNTLNAISTMVLENARDDANKMVTKLSAFLRYTLVNQPTQKVTLEQELYALGLYLDIEKVRFEDRLKIEYDIDERAKPMLIPSLILQPLIENAIKYGIAPSMDGGTIAVKARTMVDGRRLVIELSDTGPGIQDIEHIKSQSGSGVGIANTRERLAQIYPGDHVFRITNLLPQGLSITIDIPSEREAPAMARSY